MKSIQTVRADLQGAFSRPRIWLVQAIGNPVLLALFLLWLLIPVARAFHLVLNVVLIAIVVLGAIALHAGTLLRFGAEAGTESHPRRALQHTVAILVWCLIAYWIWTEVDRLEPYHWQLPGYLYSEMPGWMRALISESALDSLYAATMFLLKWIVVPAVLLPFFALSARTGQKAVTKAGFRDACRYLRSLAWWAAVVIAAVVGIWLPSLLLDWHPLAAKPDFTRELVSLILRLVVAYALALVSWMLLLACLGRGVGRNGAAAQPA